VVGWHRFGFGLESILFDLGVLWFGFVWVGLVLDVASVFV
jgi:hypothetical protein